MPTYDEIFEKVQATLVDALGVDEEDVTQEATLQGDLGAESIDFLDIVFRLERNFGIKIPRGELFPENLVADPEWVSDGKLTGKGIERAQEPAAVRRPEEVCRQSGRGKDRGSLHGRHVGSLCSEQVGGLNRSHEPS